PTLNNNLFPGNPNLNPNAPHFVAARAINHPGMGPKLPPSPMQVRPGFNGPMHPMHRPAFFPGRPGVTIPPGTLISIPPGAPVPQGFFPIGHLAPHHRNSVTLPPTYEQILDANDRHKPKTPLENPLVTFFSKLFGKPSGAQSVGNLRGSESSR
ncbi:hypothetical protein PFISCL1PPCAC_23410, partial [Pristionchus fissidentatus]